MDFIIPASCIIVSTFWWKLQVRKHRYIQIPYMIVNKCNSESQFNKCPHYEHCWLLKAASLHNTHDPDLNINLCELYALKEPSECCQELNCTFNPQSPITFCHSRYFKVYSCGYTAAWSWSSSLMEQDRLVSFTSEYRKQQLMFTETIWTVQGHSRDDWNVKFWGILLESSQMFYWCSALCVKQSKNCNVLTMKMKFPFKKMEIILLKANLVHDNSISLAHWFFFLLWLCLKYECYIHSAVWDFIMGSWPHYFMGGAAIWCCLQLESQHGCRGECGEGWSNPFSTSQIDLLFYHA